MTEGYEQHLYKLKLNRLGHLSLEKTHPKGGKDMMEVSEIISSKKMMKTEQSLSFSSYERIKRCQRKLGDGCQNLKSHHLTEEFLVSWLESMSLGSFFIDFPLAALQHLPSTATVQQKMLD